MMWIFVNENVFGMSKVYQQGLVYLSSTEAGKNNLENKTIHNNQNNFMVLVYSDFK